MSEQNNNTAQRNAPMRGPMRGGPMGRGMMGGGKAKNFKKSIGRLVRYCKPFAVPMLIALFFAAAAAVISVILPNRMSEIVDVISKDIFNIDFVAIRKAAMIYAALIALSFLLNFIQGYVMAGAVQDIIKKMRGDLSSKINRMPLKYFDKTVYGDSLSRVVNDTDLIGNSLNQSAASLVSAVTLFIGSVIMMFWTNWIMALTAILSSLIGFGLMTLIMKKSQKFFAEQQKKLGAVNGHIEEIYSGHNVVKASNAQKNAKKEFEVINSQLYNSAYKAMFFAGLMMPLMGFIGHLSYVAVCVAGGLLAFNGQITFGVIAAFIIYTRIFMQPMQTLGQAGMQLQSMAAAAERVFEFLDEPEMEKDSVGSAARTATPSASRPPLERGMGDVEFEHVKFGYDKDKIIINDFTAYVEAGQKIAIVGPTGAGKTTVVNLLMRFYEVDGGKILIGGVDTKEMTRQNVRDLFGMVLQDTWIFNGTIKENIIYNRKGVTDGQVVNACKAANLHHFIMTLPGGYDAVLGDNLNMSQGQIQLLTIARALVKDSPLLILDEATSSVDTRTEVLIQEAMDKLMKGRTSFVIAHRLSTIKNADLILVMKDGDIIESGTHERLMADAGFYSELYNSQFVLA